MKYHTSNRAWWVRVPADLIVAIGVALLANLVFLLGITHPVVRVAVGLPLLFFLPGYAVVALACPATLRVDAPTGGRRGRLAAATLGRRGIDAVERLALAFGVSVALLPLLGLVAAVLPGGYATSNLVAMLTGVVAVASVLAAVRRWQLPEDERFRPRFWTWGSRLRTAVFGSGGALATLVNVALAVSVVLALSTITYGLAVPTDGERYSRLSVLTQNDDGELVMGGYPDELSTDAGAELVVAVENREQQRQSYTVVVELQRVRTDGNQVTVVEQSELDRMSTTLASGDTWNNPHVVQPTMTGENLRLTYYLYEGEAPEDASGSTADQQAFVWVNVTG